MAEGPPPSPVGYTEAREHEVRQNVRLPGTVEAQIASPVTSEVEGFVVRLIAHEGQHVRVGDPLAQLRTTNLDLRLQAEKGQLKEAEARLARARLALARNTRLMEQDLVAQEDLDDSQAEFHAWEGRVEQTRANIERIELDLERCTIRAPFAGAVVAEHIDVGSWLRVGDPVVALVSTDLLEVRVLVPGRYFHMVQLGERAGVEIEGNPPYAISGSVSAIIPQADVRARVFPIKLSLDDSAGGAGATRVAAGMLVHVDLPIGSNELATVVPKDAIVTQGHERVVFVIQEDDTVQRRSVRTLGGFDSWVAVHGIRSGEKVVTRGNERIFPGQKVQGTREEYALR
jgi:RND family efflux transporter MFP subunit